jgi:aryl-alcohol dehydrogenase-like predicted oxidoreductase
MEQRDFFSTLKISALALGGGGIGQVWGTTTREEAVATLREAVNCDINWIDVAPSYGNGEAEQVVGEAFHGSLPTGVRVSTKCKLLTGEAIGVADRMAMSLEASLTRMELASVDLLMLHNMILDPLTQSPKQGCTLQDYQEIIIPAFLERQGEGIIRAWGITGIAFPGPIGVALETFPKPSAVQVITNALDSAGDIQGFEGPFTPRETIGQATQNGVGVMGIRAVQAGALTDEFDRIVDESSTDMQDYIKAQGFRVLAARLGLSPAVLAHRYALSIDGVATIVLGVKNRRELYDCLEAEEHGKLDEELVSLVDTAIRPDR